MVKIVFHRVRRVLFDEKIAGSFHEKDEQLDKSLLGHYQSMLDETVLFQKLETLHNKIKTTLGVEPKIHRAGRWANRR